MNAEANDGVFEEIRRGSAWVAGRSRFVRINRERIEAYAASLPLARIQAPEIDAERHYVGRGEATAAFFLILDSVNFGSGYFPHLKKRSGMSGYFTVASSLTDAFRANGAPTAEALVETTAEDCAALFGQNLDNPPIRELMGLFARAMNDLGRLLIDRFDGEYVALIESANGSAERLVALLAEMPLYRDVQQIEGRDIAFYKRAQLTVADLSLAFSGAGLGRFHDLDRLTIFADNLVPHVLRLDGVLDYDADLIARIEREELIPPGSDEEIEIRACAVHGVELIADALPATAHQLDYLLWNRGQEPSYKAVPRHRTHTTFY